MRQRKLVAIDWCPICEQNIYPHEMYDFFVDGYGHRPCIEFVRTQARLMRDNG